MRKEGGRILLYLPHDRPTGAGMVLLIWRKKRERDSKRGELHSRGQGSDWETVRDWYPVHS